MKEIQLSQGKVALVDDEDFEAVSAFNWCFCKNKNRPSSSGYAVRNALTSELRHTTQQMQVFIFGKKNGFFVDHKDGDGLNNQRNNLRFCTNQQNQRNRARIQNGTSGYKGVSRFRNKWISNIGLDNKCVYIGVFHDKEEAARAYDAKARELFGEFARLNFPE